MKVSRKWIDWAHGPGAEDGQRLAIGRFAIWPARPAAPASSSLRGAATVTGVADSDTLYADIEGHTIRTRLAQIDAPEKAQSFGRRSEQSLCELVGKRPVLLWWKSLDRYGRPIAQVSIDGMDVNAEQVRRGFAWVFRRYSNDHGFA
jgi:micrococcal nuclease